MTESAGLLLYRRAATGVLEVLLVHPGGPFFRNKDEGAWSIPKGEIDPDEDALGAAVREVAEETGLDHSGAVFIPLGSVRQKSGKVVHAWAIAFDCDPRTIVSNTFSIEWPPRSGRTAEFPEVDRASFFALEQARAKIHPAQAALLDRLVRALERPPSLSAD